MARVNDTWKEIRMDRNIPLPGTFYRHSDGNICQIMCIARNYVDKDKEVVYQEMFPPFDIWTEPLRSFMEETAGRDGSRKYKFEQVEAASIPVQAVKTLETELPADAVPHTGNGITFSEEITDSMFRECLLNGTVDTRIAGKMPDSDIAEKGFMELLDADNYHDKYHIFTSMKKYLNKHLLNNIAVALDIVLEDGDEEEQYDSILHCLQTFEHYETSRLR